MKKAVKIALPMLLIAMIFTIQTIKADYLVTVNSTFQYDVIESDLNVTFGTNTADLDGFEIEGNFFNPGATVDLNVTSVNPTQVLYNISSGSYSEIRAAQPLDELYLLLLMLYPIALVHDVSVSTWNATELEDDFHEGLFMVPFLSIDADTWDDWMGAVEDINANKTIVIETFTDALTVEARYLNLTNDFIFEFYMNGQLDEQYTFVTTNSLINVTIEHQYQFAFAKATGVLRGMRMEGSISGFCNGTVVNMDYNYKTEQVGYDLPSYGLGGPTWPFPGFEYLIALSVLGTLTTIMVLVRRRK
jgi:hypothetical protein